MATVNGKAYRITERRKLLGWSMRKLALAAGMRPETVAAVERELHVRRPHRATLVLLDKVLSEAEDSRPPE
jgi:transcriptional regulator with XRE-family HTH domain